MMLNNQRPVIALSSVSIQRNVRNERKKSTQQT